MVLFHSPWLQRSQTRSRTPSFSGRQGYARRLAHLVASHEHVAVSPQPQLQTAELVCVVEPSQRQSMAA